jgi:hypothetical protein
VKQRSHSAAIEALDLQYEALKKRVKVLEERLGIQPLLP